MDLFLVYNLLYLDQVLKNAGYIHLEVYNNRFSRNPESHNFHDSFVIDLLELQLEEFEPLICWVEA